ncbi:MAG: metallophosphoesterase [Pseudomonadota bacterium]
MRETDGHRIYAIGDIHGLDGRLAAVHARIAADIAARPHPKPIVIHLGDLVDRGRESRAVIDRLIRAEAGGIGGAPSLCLRGNHDQYLIDALEVGWTAESANWLEYGGVETCASYGVRAGFDVDIPELREAVPEAHRAFLSARPYHARIGGYLFVHAGIRPGLPLARQRVQDMIWIRNEFLQSRADHGFVVVHGHTVVKRVEDHGNRIGIDTGAVYGGTLSCLVLEGAEAALLTEDGLAPVPRA